MFLVLRVVIRSFAAALGTRSSLTAENIARRHQLGIFQRRGIKKASDHFLGPSSLGPSGLSRWRGWKDALVIVKPKTVIEWHRKSLSALLDLEVARWSTESQGADQDAGPAYGDRESDLGCAQDPWELLMLGYRVSERTVSRYLERIRPTPMKRRSQNLADLPAEPGQRHRLRRSLHGAAGSIPDALHLRHPSPRHTTNRRCFGDPAPDSPLARSADHQRFSVGHSAAFSNPRSRQGLRQGVLRGELRGWESRKS